ncbi:MAG: OmpA family protein [Oscillospiraceae bacterium]|nr:OmpA family protein [Oscillospiraceae bacterium]
MAASSDDRGNERAGGGDGEQEERTDGWMATYADMVTLLLTFFVLMFALSNVDNEKAELFLFAMSRDGLTAEQFWEIRDRYDPSDLDGSEWDEFFPYPPPGADEDDEGGGEAEKALEDLYNAINNWIDAEGLRGELAVAFNGDFLMLTLLNDVWFDPGSAHIPADMVERANVIGELLAANFLVAEPFEILVAGHTDNVPMSNIALYPTNWHLSAARATNFMELLIAASHLEPWHFYANSCGEYRPIATNDTPEGRQANRRVEVMITRARANPLWDEMFNSD